MRRPWLLARGVFVDRKRPDLTRLASIEDPMEFVWAMLPYAARTFATSILMLPKDQSKTAAVAYLYCRMLDTCEDLTTPDDRVETLAAFSERMGNMDPPPAVELAARDEQDKVFILLVERCRLVDYVFLTLPEVDQKRIVELVQAMADGMIWSAQRFLEQGGVLTGMDQVRRYCGHVIGEPVLFALDLVLGSSQGLREDAMAVAQLIQLANITRDIERDLLAGIAYHPALKGYLGGDGSDAPVQEVRRELLRVALPNVSGFRRLLEATPTTSLARASAILMILHTDQHYGSCLQKADQPGWSVPSSPGIIARAVIVLFSQHWSSRILRQVEQRFLRAAELLDGADPGDYPQTARKPSRQ